MKIEITKKYNSPLEISLSSDLKGRKKAIDDLMVILDNSYKIPKFIKQDNITLN